MSDAMHRDSGLVTGPELARTYAHPAYADPWDAVEDFRAVKDYAERHPGAGSTAVANHFELPRSRVRPWLEGSRPDCVRGLEAAEAHGWVDVAPDSTVFRGLNVMLAWIFSGGSVLSDTWVPYWVSDDESDRELLDRAAALVGVELDYTRSASAGDGRARELRPIEDASVLGRVLVVLGAPRGEKNEASDIVLPGYLEDAPERVRREFVQIYLRNRGHARETSDVINFREVRSDDYLRSVAALIRDLTDEAVSVSAKNVILSEASVEEVRTWSPVLGHRPETPIGEHTTGRPEDVTDVEILQLFRAADGGTLSTPDVKAEFGYTQPAAWGRLKSLAETGFLAERPAGPGNATEWVLTDAGRAWLDR